MKTVELCYRAPDGREIRVRVCAPTAPDLIRVLEEALAARGFQRVEDATS